MQYWFKLILNSQRKRILWGVFWAFFTALSGTALLALSGWFITATAVAGVGIAAGLVVRFDLYIPGSGIRFFALSRTIARYTERIYNHDTILKLISVFRVRLFKRLSALPLHRLRSASDSEWLTRLTADLDALDNILIRFTVPLVSAILLILSFTFFLAFIHLEIALFFAAFLLLSLVISIRYTIKKTAPLAKKSASTLAALRGSIISHLQGAFVLQSQCMMEHHEQILLSALDEFYQVQRGLNRRLGNIKLCLDLAFGIALIALVSFSLLAAEAGDINGPVAVMLVMLFLGIAELVQSAPEQFSAWGKTQFSSHRLISMFRGVENTLEPRVHSIDSVSVSLDAHPKVPSSYQQPISLSITPKARHLVLGRSGSGKSTIANLIAGIEPAIEGSGEALLNSNVPTEKIKPSQWFTSLAYLEQSNTIFSGSLRYNLNLGVERFADERLWQALEMVELKDWAMKLPNGLDTWLGETGGQVSGGQARRICLSRFLLRTPSLVLLDEPFNGIDTGMAARIWKNISPWLMDKTLVLFSHERPRFLDDCDIDLEINLNIAEADKSAA